MLVLDKPFIQQPQLRIAGWILLTNFIGSVALALTSTRMGISTSAVLAISYCVNAIACYFLGVAANLSGKSWLLYGLLPAAGMLLPFSLYSYYKLRTDSYFKWLDEHATYVDDRSA